MPSRTRSVRSLVAAAAVVATTAATVGLAPQAHAASGPSESITVFLKAPHPQALTHLALAAGLARGQRLAALSRLVPGAATHAGVEGTLRAEGFSVTHSTAWSLTARGPASLVRSLFGTRPALGAADLARAAGPLPQLPLPLRASVSAVFPTAAGPAPFHHATTALDGTDFRNAYTPAGVAPSTGQNSGGTTIATLQLADFYGATPGPSNDTQASDLTGYANEHGLPDPVASGQYKPVIVDGGPSATDDSTGGDVEVDLDQESILSTAPSADQHAYFAPNTNAGFDDVIASVYDDVTGDSHATAPDPHITALSISWGQCESGWGKPAIDTLEPILESLVAAGVTVFASSGDDGIYDCRSSSGTGLDNSQADVDFPASSPVVVAVGGTNLSAAASKPNTGTNWTEKSWTCTDAVSCQSTATGTGGTGGGASGSAYSSTTTDSFPGFPAPAYQQAGIEDKPFAGAATRLVPDIAADADPNTGFVVYTSDPQYVVLAGGSNDLQVGGTSLASPISAAQFDNALADSGRATGVGDIHNALYAAYRGTESLPATDSAKAVRDITKGSNGAAADKGSDPSVAAGPGYDTNTGVGAPLWSAVIPYLTASGTPVARATLVYTGAHNTRAPYRVVAQWSSRQGSDTSLIAGATVALRAAGRRKPVFTADAASGRHAFRATPGTTYRLIVRATDLAGHTGTARSTVNIPVDDRQFTFAGKWARVAASRDIAGTHAVGLGKGARARVTATGRRFALRVHVGPRLGKLAVRQGKHLVGVVDLYSARPAIRRIAIYRSTARARRTFTFTMTGRKARASKGTRVTLDALYVFR